jgi:hypothetical protein
VIGSPLRGLSDEYRNRVAADVAVQSGGTILTRTPLAHADHLFWVARGVAEHIGVTLARAWCHLNAVRARSQLAAWEVARARGVHWMRRVAASLELAAEFRTMHRERAPIGQFTASP